MRPGLRFEVFKRDAFTCRYCGRKSPEAILETDHIVPRVAGGLDEIENLVTACYVCNRGKGARLLTEIPVERDLHEKAIAIAERELQIAEYNHWKATQRQREDSELGALLNAWVDRWQLDTSWQTSEVRKFLRVLGYDAILDIFEIVSEQTKLTQNSWHRSAWIFFCGICRARLKSDR